MHPYIEDWLKIIDGMNNENTYKLAWGRALVEICHEKLYQFSSNLSDYLKGRFISRPINVIKL